VNELLERLRHQFESEEARYAYVEGFLNTHIAAQIKELREGEKMSQQELADKIGTKQSGISRLENINYSAWKVESLRKLARAFGLWLDIDFKEFGELPIRIQNFNKAGLRRRRFERDPIFTQGDTHPKRRRKVHSGAKKRVHTEGRKGLRHKPPGRERFVQLPLEYAIGQGRELAGFSSHTIRGNNSIGTNPSAGQLGVINGNQRKG